MTNNDKQKQFEDAVFRQIADLNRRLNEDLQRERAWRMAAEMVLAQNGIEIASVTLDGVVQGKDVTARPADVIEQGDPVTAVMVEREDDGTPDRPLPDMECCDAADGDGYTEAINRGDVDELSADNAIGRSIARNDLAKAAIFETVNQYLAKSLTAEQAIEDIDAIQAMAEDGTLDSLEHLHSIYVNPATRVTNAEPTEQAVTYATFFEEIMRQVTW